MASLTAAFAALAVHLFLFPIPEVSTIKVLSTYVTVNVALFSYELASSVEGDLLTRLVNAVYSAFILNAIFLGVFIPVTVVRRLYFSPLSSFPGPKFAAVTKLWDANEFRLGKVSVVKQQLHKRYASDFVRTGPNELSINNVEAIAQVYKGKYPRGTFYEAGALNGAFNLNTVRDYKVHTPWRRVWEKAFQSSEFKEYDRRVEYHVEKLMAVIRPQAKKGREVNCTKMAGDLIFDIMADLAFANDAGMQDGTGDDSFMFFIHKYLAVLSVVATLRNLCQLAFYLPQSSELKEFIRKGDVLFSERQKLGASRKDIFSHLLAVDAETGERFTQAELNANASLVIVAGADTSSSVLAQTFGQLARHPEILKKLQLEVDQVQDLTVESVRNLPYLNAVVNEALRLCNPIPSGIQATTPVAGLTISGTYIPGNVQVRVSALLMLDERYFPKGEEFIPERFSGERPELYLDRRAYFPFGSGVHSCVGKQLALNELRLTIAKVSKEFDIEFGESWNEEVFKKEWADYAVLKIGALWVKFVSRK